MTPTHHRTLRRCLTVWTLATAALAAAWALAGPEVLGVAEALREGTWRLADLEQLLAWLAAAVTLAAVSWSWAVTGILVLGAARGCPRAHLRGCPDLLRRCVLTACGVAVGAGLVGGVVAPAGAEVVPAPATDRDGVAGGAGAGVPTRGGSGGLDLDGLPTPDRAPGTGARRAGPREDQPRPSTPDSPDDARTDEVVVRPGDTLWDLAADRLGRRGDAVTAADVDRAWRHLHHLNAGVIGSNPDLIRPGQQLRTHRTDRERR